VNDWVLQEDTNPSTGKSVGIDHSQLDLLYNTKHPFGYPRIPRDTLNVIHDKERSENILAPTVLYFPTQVVFSKVQVLDAHLQ